MDKKKFLIATKEDYPKGYGDMDLPSRESRETWNLIMNYLSENEQYLNHFIISEWEKDDKEIDDKKSFAKGIPTGIMRYYLEIYYQTKG